MQKIELYGGEAVVDDYPNRLNLDRITHIVSSTFDFPDYYDALDRFVQIVKPEWVSQSVSMGRLAHPRRFSPDPNLFMSDVVATCADLPSGDQDAIAGGILAMGGNYSAKLTSQTTHIVALTMENDKVEQVIKHDLKMVVVLPHWFDDCLKLGKKINEGPYTLPDPEILRGALDRAPSGQPSKYLEGATSPHPPGRNPPSLAGRKGLKVFNKKRILLDKDLEIGLPLRNVLIGMILASDGVVIEEIVDADILVCKYRQGDNYNTATRRKIDVGNLAWLYYLIVHDVWTSPYRRLLHYPLPKEPLPSFKGLKISLSNYSGEARTYLENLIIATGAECTKTLRQENAYLITAHKKSEKVSAAEDWNITVVNHLWVEESYAQWHMQSVTKSRYTHFPQHTNLGDVVGQTQIDPKVIECKFLRVDHEMLDAPPTGRRGKANAKALDGSTPAKEDARRVSKGQSSVVQTPATSRVKVNGKENTMTPTTVSSRKSKEAAAAKLHEMTPDIALFEKEKKRVGGVVYGGRRKDDPERVDASRKRSSESAEVDIPAEKASKKQRTGPAPIQMHLLISGYKAWVGKPKKEDDDIKKLREFGIAIVDHPAKASHLAVPGIVRTAKFMIALAHAPKILSTDYIEACLEQDERVEPEKFELADKESEKKFSVSLKKALDNARTNERKLLEHHTLYCTEKIVGGLDTLRAIADANGTALTPYRGRHTIIPSRRVSSDNDSPEGEVYLLSNDNEEDRRLWPKFVKMVEDSRRTPRVLISEWLLSTALRQEIQPLSSYELNVD